MDRLEGSFDAVSWCLVDFKTWQGVDVSACEVEVEVSSEVQSLLRDDQSLSHSVAKH